MRQKNQLSLFNDIKIVFDAYDSGTYSASISSKTIVEKDHGRLEIRTYEVCKDIFLLSNHYKWPKLVSFARVHTIRETNKGDSIAD